MAKQFVPYKDALEDFTSIRKEMNGYVENGEIDKAKEMFDLLKVYAANEHAISMDVLAYYYKTGVENIVPENYNRYLEWELLAAARGNEFAIEKLQFLIGFACEQIIESEDFDEIAYKNDIDDENLLYILGKNICKVIVKKHLHIFPSDLATASDIEEKYTQEDYINFRKLIEKALPDVIEAMK